MTTENRVTLRRLSARGYVSKVRFSNGQWFGSCGNTFFRAPSLPDAVKAARSLAAQKTSYYYGYDSRLYPQWLREHLGQ